MFKKNPNRPPITINLKKVTTGYKVVPNESFNPFSFKRITRAIFRCTSTLMQLISHMLTLKRMKTPLVALLQGQL